MLAGFSGKENVPFKGIDIIKGKQKTDFMNPEIFEKGRLAIFRSQTECSDIALP